MKAETYLERIPKIDALLENLKREYQRQITLSDDIGGGLSFAGRVQTSSNPNKRAAAVGRYIDIEGRIKALEAERDMIIRTLEVLPTPEYKLLYKIYVEGYMVKQLPYELNKSYDWVRKTKAKALRHIQKILDSRKDTP